MGITEINNFDTPYCGDQGDLSLTITDGWPGGEGVGGVQEGASCTKQKKYFYVHQRLLTLDQSGSHVNPPTGSDHYAM